MRVTYESIIELLIEKYNIVTYEYNRVTYESII